MKLSNAQRLVLNEMLYDWLLFQGKVMEGRPEVILLKKIINNSMKVQKVSTATFKSLILNGLIERESTYNTSILFRMTRKAGEILKSESY